MHQIVSTAAKIAAPDRAAALQEVRGDKRLPLIAIILSLSIFVAMLPYARTQLPRVDAFIPVYQSALIISDLITAVLLYTHFSAHRSRALLALGGGYLFTAAMAAMHLLTFPGLFAPGGLLGAGPQTTAWLYMFWHGVFPLAVIAYASLKGRDTKNERPDVSSTRVAMLKYPRANAARRPL